MLSRLARIIAVKQAPSRGRSAVAALVLAGLVVALTPVTLLSAPAANPPNLLFPANGFTATIANFPPVAMPYFEWQAVPGTTSYRIQIDNDPGFAPPIFRETTTPNTRYIPNDAANFADGTWYWRVRVDAPLPVSNWSEQRTFSKDWAGSTAPTLLSPVAGATLEFFEAPAFSWTPVTGAADYVWRVYSDPSCTTLAPGAPQPNTLTTHYNLATRLNNGTYYWQVTPRNVGVHDGTKSECRQVIVSYSQSPQLLEPANGAQPVYTPRFRWTAVKGAYAYYLYYSTDSAFTPALTTKVTTNQTSWTPKDSLPNDQQYYWKVTAVYGSNAEGPASEVRTFTKKWYHQPILLSPRNNELVNPPLFTWTPVREARYYEVEMNFDPGFAPGQREWLIQTPNTFYWRTGWRQSVWGRTAYWRVRPIDNGNKAGEYSVIASFRPTYTVALAEPIFPRYFYLPPSIASGNYASPYDIPQSYDYTVDTPTFYWSRVFVPGQMQGLEANFYKLEVDDDPNFGSRNWVYETQNLSATPTDGAPFTPTPGVNYYWRVTPCLSSPCNYNPVGGSTGVLTGSARNEAWMTRIDTSRLVAPTATTSPTLKRPAHGEVILDTLPSFEWLPQQGAVRYEFAISDDPAFATGYVTRTVYTHHTPNVRLPKGTYYWRVRGLNGSGQTVGVWSAARRLIVAYQARWGCLSCPVGATNRNFPDELLPLTARTQLAIDADDGLGPTELTTLHAALGKDFWYVGFHVSPALSDSVWYALYFDVNQTDGSGAPAAPANRPSVTTSSSYRPEYALYVTFSGTQSISPNIPIHTWNAGASSWDAQIKNLMDPIQVGGDAVYSPTLNYVELKIPRTAIGDLGISPYVLSVALFSANSQTAPSAADTVPNNGNSTPTLNEFKSIADRSNASVPPQDTSLPYTPYVYGETPNVDYLRGYRVEVARDPLFTSVLETSTSDCENCEPFVDIFQYLYSALRIYEDNTLYWRYSIKRRVGSTESFSPPSQAYRFTRVGPLPNNLRREGSYSTPTFVWNAVEGAAAYRFQLSTNTNFSPLALEDTTNHETFTPASSYAPGAYYWRVRAENGQGGTYQGAWSLMSTLNITLPVASLVAPAPAAVVRSVPTFKWNAVLTPTATPAWGASRYHLQVANSPTGFSAPFEDVVLDTLTWTPTKSYPDGVYYWRVAARDAAGRDGPYSPVYTFTKQYRGTTLVSPLSGAPGTDFPTFVWTPVEGAARYRIEIAKNAQFSPLWDSATTDNVRFIPTKKYDSAQYYWRVAMIDKSGAYGPYTGAVFLNEPLPIKAYLPAVLKNR